MPAGWGEALNLIFGLGFFALIAAIAVRPKRRKPEPVEDGPPDEPYRIYTTEFDLELRADRILDDLVLTSPDFARGQFNLEPDRGLEAMQRSDAAFAESAAGVAESERALIGEGIASRFADTNVAILLDQSGSMRGANAVVAVAALKHLTTLLERWGARTEILGFSTVGWWGGRAAQKWKASGRPKRPGRLCATLHIVYKAVDDDPMSDDKWRTMFDPNLYRENVDGEALQWALGRLEARGPGRKAIIILSDGAPVDDATLMYNGESYLHRHHLHVVADIERRPDVALSAIGVNYWVDDWYLLASCIRTPSDIPPALAYIARGLADHLAGQP